MIPVRRPTFKFSWTRICLLLFLLAIFLRYSLQPKPNSEVPSFPVQYSTRKIPIVPTTVQTSSPNHVINEREPSPLYLPLKQHDVFTATPCLIPLEAFRHDTGFIQGKELARQVTTKCSAQPSPSLESVHKLRTVLEQYFCAAAALTNQSLTDFDASVSKEVRTFLEEKAFHGILMKVCGVYSHVLTDGTTSDCVIRKSAAEISKPFSFAGVVVNEQFYLRNILGHLQRFKRDMAADPDSKCPIDLEEIPLEMHQTTPFGVITGPPHISRDRYEGMWLPGTRGFFDTWDGSLHPTRSKDVDMEEDEARFQFGSGTVGERAARLQRVQRLVQYHDPLMYNKHIYVDLGARLYSQFESIFDRLTAGSPARNWSRYAFEAEPKYAKQFAGKDVTFYSAAAGIVDGIGSWTGGGMGQLLTNSEDHRGHTVKVIDFRRWIKSVAGPKDFVLVKMDIEGAEHQILEAMIKDSSIELLDELFVEAHYEHFFRGGIMTFHRYWSDIRDTLLRLRARGVCAHEWF